ncbi:hypothetical protein D3C72_1903400 [compost metagenome]
MDAPREASNQLRVHLDLQRDRRLGFVVEPAPEVHQGRREERDLPLPVAVKRDHALGNRGSRLGEALKPCDRRREASSSLKNQSRQRLGVQAFHHDVRRALNLGLEACKQLLIAGGRGAEAF